MTNEERFWSKVNKIANGCWEWTASKNKWGYGKFWLNCKSTRAHRFSYELYNGPISNDLHVCHTCDNPACVRPDHLFLGTDKDNMEDKVKKGRQTKGSTNGQAKLSEADILDIRSKQLSYKEYMKKYNISRSHIYDIWNCKRWTHI